ncbi:Rhomboid protease GluP [Aquisphaera giovannonii]|uniref:Rhomboid protease GluP n=1 Tax=Aquisphaera giovannonii TaxID=406548 RepID=A0A5B9W8K1_9BACT|nr:rhomboid family intramembrane serine protease [Aquisphaera giovannonii]QEH36697.1 Rhomboid protease GluP [Aquisphaera giovannonii]
MTARSLLREIRQFPATVLFSLAWVVVFAAMAVLWRQGGPADDWWGLLIRGVGNGHRFGALTLADIRHGQVWRLVTCNFVHFSLLHLGVNLFAFYLLGSLVESWYGSSLFTAIYLISGSLGNLLAMLVRLGMGSNPLNQSGGGSVVIMALIGLCAMVGWRSRTPMGSDLGWQMAKAVVMTGLLGVAFSRYIDNLGHLGGLLVGLPIGALHPRLLKRYGRPLSWFLGQVAAAVIVASGAAQWAAEFRHGTSQNASRDETLRRALDETNMTMRVLSLLGERPEDRKDAARAFESAGAILEAAGGRVAFRRGAGLALQASRRRLTDAEEAELDRCLGSLSRLVLVTFARVFELGPDPAGVDRLKAIAAVAETRPLTDAEREEYRRELAIQKRFVSRELAERVRRYWRQEEEEARKRARLH